MPTGDGTLGRLAGGIADVVGDGVASAQKSARHTADAFRDLAVPTAGARVPVSTYSLKGAEKKFTPVSMPTDEWAGRGQRRAAGMGAEGALTRQATGHLRRLREAGQLPGLCGVAIDITMSPRHDGNRGGGSHHSKAHAAAQRVERGAGTVVAACGLTPRDTVAGRLSLVGSRVLAACAAAGIAPLLPVDRGFFSAAAIAWPDMSGAGWLMPCRNTPRARAALREFAAGIRPRVSTFWITDRLGRRVAYTMTMEKRRKRRRG